VRAYLVQEVELNEALVELEHLTDGLDAIRVDLPPTKATTQSYHQHHRERERDWHFSFNRRTRSLEAWFKGTPTSHTPQPPQQKQ